MATEIPDNAARFTAAEMATLCGGELHGVADDAGVVGVTTDSRRVGERVAFVALSGESFDGHRFVDAATRAGATLSVVREAPGEAPVLKVADTLQALGALGRAHRRRWARPVVALTGSVGKTTTKELLAAALEGATAEAVARTRGNLNNLVGVPMTLLALTAEERRAVVEAGTNAPGEITTLGALIEPEVALVTRVALSHAEGLGTLEAVGDEKASLFEHATSALVANRDDDVLWPRAEAGRRGRRLVGFGRSDAGDVQLVERTPIAGFRQRVRLRVRGAGELELDQASLGEGAAMAASASLAVLVALDADEAGLRRGLAAIADVPPVAGRLAVRRAGGVTIIDDSYNASPASMRLGLDTAVELAERSGGRVLAALGEMRELGDHSDAEHASLAEYVKGLSLSGVVVVGDAMAPFTEMDAPFWVAKEADADAAAARLAPMLRDGDVVLVKGSRALRMEIAVEYLLREAAEA